MQRSSFAGLSSLSLNYKQLRLCAIDENNNYGFKLRRFEHKFKNLSTVVDNEFIKDIVVEINSFKNDNKVFLEKIDEWTTTVIWLAYSERNLETHNNLKSDYSYLNIQNSILLIGEAIYRVFINKCSDEKSIDEFLKKIKS